MLWSPGVSDPLLIDECLSAELPAIAHELGFEAYHVAHFGLAGAPILVPLRVLAKRVRSLDDDLGRSASEHRIIGRCGLDGIVEGQRGLVATVAALPMPRLPRRHSSLRAHGPSL